MRVREYLGTRAIGTVRSLSTLWLERNKKRKEVREDGLRLHIMFMSLKLEAAYSGL